MSETTDRIINNTTITKPRKISWQKGVKKGYWKNISKSLIEISSMSDDYLQHCINFAKTNKQHERKLPELLNEQQKRN